MRIIIHGIDEVRRRVTSLRDGLAGKVKEFLQRLGDFGVDLESVRFRTAQYDGTNDVSVTTEWKDEKTLIIHADGQAVAFIEFGTGVHYKEAHPKAAEFGAIRGTYGHGLGKLDFWRYRGDPGTNGVIYDDPTLPHFGMVATYGNPPARAVYDTIQDLRDKISEIAKEVFA